MYVCLYIYIYIYDVYCFLFFRGLELEFLRPQPQPGHRGLCAARGPGGAPGRSRHDARLVLVETAGSSFCFLRCGGGVGGGLGGWGTLFGVV